MLLMRSIFLAFDPLAARYRQLVGTDQLGRAVAADLADPGHVGPGSEADFPRNLAQPV